MIGKKILHYDIKEKLGEGGMGIVYLAEDTKLKRKVAIKFLPPHISSSDEEQKRLEIEAQAAASLNHPSIATIYSIEESNDQNFIVMEYIEGEELKSSVGAHHDAPLSLDIIIQYAVQIAEGLQAAHESGVVHRDIKSSNIMLTDKGRIKIMDFGLAKFRGSVQVTKAGTTLGTAAYMSPEQARGDDIDPRTDIWSFGVVLYEMLTGQLPFKGDYDSAMIYSILNEPPIPVQEINPNLDSAVIHVLDRLLEKDVENRYQSMDVVLRELYYIQKKSDSSRISKQREIPTEYNTSLRDQSSINTEVEKSKSVNSSKKINKLILPAILIIVIFAIYASGLFKIGGPDHPTFRNMKISRLTTSGKASQGCLSPDGNYLVYVLEDRGKQSLQMY